MRYFRPIVLLILASLAASVMAVVLASPAEAQVSFGAPTNFAVGSASFLDRPAPVAVGDFNGDSKPDLATANNFSHNVSVLLNAGGGSFGAPR